MSLATVLTCQTQLTLCLPSKNRRLPSVFSSFCQIFPTYFKFSTSFKIIQSSLQNTKIYIIVLFHFLYIKYKPNRFRVTMSQIGVHMLNISGIQEGFVLDHIQAGMSLQIYHDLKLDQLDCTVAIIKNAKSNKMGKKDILKVECPVEALDLDILGFIDHNITVNVIKDSKIVEKKELHMPKQVKNVIRCKNPRCITSIEQELDQIFLLTDEAKEVYRCKYCEEKYTNPNRR